MARYTMTPARRAALKKAQAASARKRRAALAATVHPWLAVATVAGIGALIRASF